MALRVRTLLSVALLAVILATAASCGAEHRRAGDTPGEPTPASGGEASDVSGEGLEEEGVPAGEASGPDASGPDGADALPADGEVREPEPAPPPSPISLPDEPPTFERPEHVRGVYVNAWSAGSTDRMESLIRLARATEINSLVIDLKDVSGRLSYSSGVKLARSIGAVRGPAIRDPVGLLERLSEEGIYPIARIVIVRDPVLARARPHLAIQHRDGGVWSDARGDRWLDPYRWEVWEYHVDLAKEALRMGFPEIQWDYVRFPDVPRSRSLAASYHEGGRPDPAVIRAFLEYAREELEQVNPDVQITADVFGVTTRGGDIGIGQRWRDFIDVVDVALPMVYPSHYWTGSYGIEEPNAHPYFIVHRALRDALRSSEEVEGAGRVRPWLQDFDLGEPAYGVAEVRAQMYAAYDLGIQEWIFWNPSSRYTREAFAPTWGWAEGEEPMIRVGGRIVPAYRREAALAAFMDEMEAERLAEARADSLTEERTRLRVLDPDSLRQAVDSLMKVRDTIPPDTTRRPQRR